MSGPKINGTVDYTKFTEYQKLKEQYGDKIKCNFDENTGKLSYETGSIWNATAGSVYVDESEYQLSTEDQLNNIFNEMDQHSLDSYIEQGFMTKKNNFLDGDYYMFDAAKYEKATGKSITLGELKTMLGLEDGVLRASNEHIFSNGGNADEMTAKGKYKIPGGTLFQENSQRKGY